MSWNLCAVWDLVAIIALMAMAGRAAEEPPRAPAPPQVFLETGIVTTPVTGQTITVDTGGDFQAALNKAQPGDEIVLQAGSTYMGNFILPVREGSGKRITIRTSNMAGLPKEGMRVSPQDAAAMPKIVAPNANPAISTTLRAGRYRLIGLEITVAPTVKTSWAIVRLGQGGPEQTTLDVVSHHVILDRVYIHGDPKHDCFRCVALDSASSAVIDSYLSEAHVVGFDAQAICGVNGPGPFKLVNNYLEGSGENIMFGGADPAIRDLVPSDIEFGGNHCFKLTNNIFGFGPYGVGIDGGQNTFAEAFPSSSVAKNLLVGHGEGRAEHLLKNRPLGDGFLFEPKHVGTSPVSTRLILSVAGPSFGRNSGIRYPRSLTRYRGGVASASSGSSPAFRLECIKDQ